MSGRILVRMKWSGHEVPLRTTGFDALRGEEVEHQIAVGEPADDPVVGGAQAADVRSEGGGERTPAGRRQRGEFRDAPVRADRGARARR